MNNSLLSKEHWALEEQTICAERILKGAVRLFSSVTKVSITKELTACSQEANVERMLRRRKTKRGCG